MTTYPQGSFQLVDHAADVGIRMEAETLGGLFEVAGMALTDIMTSVAAVAPTIERQFRIQEDGLEMLLVSWLQEILYLLDTEGLVFGRFQVNVQNCRLVAAAWGEPFDPDVHGAKTEIKAVTYHQLEIGESDRGWRAQVIIDL
ncbi:MAG: archease [Syntrophobacteria bacterium]